MPTAVAPSQSDAFRESKGHVFVRVVLFLSAFSWTLNPVGDYVDGGAPMEKVLTRMLPLVIVALYCIMGPQRDALRRLFHQGNNIVIWYIFWGIFSGLSSQAMMLSFWKGCEIFILLMWVCISCRDRESTLREFASFARLIEILLWVTVALAMINPSLGWRKSTTFIPWLQGYWPMLNPNAIGIYSAIVLLTLLFWPVKYKPMRLSFVSLTLLFSQSRTAYVAVAIGLLIFTYSAFRERNVKRLIVSLIASFVGLALALGMLDTLLRIFMRGQSSEELDTLSGRTSYWAVALDRIEFIGGGFATGSRFLDLANPDVFQKFTVNLHNSYLEAAVSAGLVGSVPYLIMLSWRSLLQILRLFLPRDPHDIFFAALSIVIVFRSMISIVLAVYSLDLIILMIFWAYTRHRLQNR